MARRDTEGTYSSDFSRVHGETRGQVPGVHGMEPGGSLICEIGNPQDYRDEFARHYLVEAAKKSLVNIVTSGVLVGAGTPLAGVQRQIEGISDDDRDKILSRIRYYAPGYPAVLTTAPLYSVGLEDGLTVDLARLGSLLLPYDEQLSSFIRSALPDDRQYQSLRCEICNDQQACAAVESAASVDAAVLGTLGDVQAPQSPAVFASGGSLGAAIDAVSTKLGDLRAPAPTYQSGRITPASAGQQPAPTNEDDMSGTSPYAPAASGTNGTGTIDKIKNDFTAAPSWIAWGFAISTVALVGISTYLLTDDGKKGSKKRRRKKRKKKRRR